MCTLEEAIGPEWRAGERGIPRRHVAFNPQEAWVELTHPTSGQFASTVSCSTHFNSPILRLVQLFLDFNLLGQSNSAVRTSMTELYLLWWAKRGRTLHLGFWTAYQCHLIATHPARNLPLCNILRAFVRNNITVIETERLSPVIRVDPPGLFDIPLFTRTNTIYIREGVPRFYAMDEVAISAERVAAAQAAQAQGQEQENLERAVEELRTENREARAEMKRMESMMERILEDIARGGSTRKSRTSGQNAEEEETSAAAEDDEEAAESEDEGSEEEENVPEVAPAPSSCPRRSRWNK